MLNIIEQDFVLWAFLFPLSSLFITFLSPGKGEQETTIMSLLGKGFDLQPCCASKLLVFLGRELAGDVPTAFR
jgi:hypothetical protein